MEGKASRKISPYAQRQEEDWRRAEPKGGAQWESSAREPEGGTSSWCGMFWARRFRVGLLTFLSNPDAPRPAQRQ